MGQAISVRLGAELRAAMYMYCLLAAVGWRRMGRRGLFRASGRICLLFALWMCALER
jgi:hypothetical protein